MVVLRKVKSTRYWVCWLSITRDDLKKIIRIFSYVIIYFFLVDREFGVIKMYEIIIYLRSRKIYWFWTPVKYSQSKNWKLKEMVFTLKDIFVNKIVCEKCFRRRIATKTFAPLIYKSFFYDSEMKENIIAEGYIDGSI